MPNSTQIAIIMEGGLIQSVVMDGAPLDADIFVVDYDVEGSDGDRLSDVPQGDGDTAEAFIFAVDPSLYPDESFWKFLVEDFT